MAVPVQSRVQSYQGDGTTTVFSFDFYIQDAADLSVIKVAVDGTPQTLAAGADYTLSGTGQVSGGSVTLAAAPQTGETVHLVAATPISSGLTLEQAGPFSSTAIEDGIDRLTRIAQETDAGMKRRPSFPVGETAPDFPAAATRTDRLLAFSPDGDAFQLGPTVTELTSALVSEDVKSVAAITAQVSSLAAVNTEIAALGAREADLGTLAPRADDLATLAPQATAMGTLGGAADDIATLAGSVSELATVAARDPDIATVAARDLQVATVSTNIDQVIAASTAVELAFGGTPRDIEVYDVSGSPSDLILPVVVDAVDKIALGVAEAEGDVVVGGALRLESFSTDVPLTPLVSGLNDQIIVGLTEDGQLYFDMHKDAVALALSKQGILVDMPPRSDYLWAVADAVYRIALGITPGGDVTVPGSLNVTGAIRVGGRNLTLGTPLSHYDFIIGYGQSLSVGSTDSRRVSTAQRYGALMPNTGLGGATENAGSFIALAESTSRESPSSGTLYGLGDLLDRENGRGLPDVGFATPVIWTPGQSGTDVAALSKGDASGLYDDGILGGMTALRDIAAAQRKTAKLQAMTWIQGERDAKLLTDRSTYLSRFLQLVSDLNADAKTVLGQSEDVIVYSYQLSGLKTGGDTGEAVALAQWDASAQSSKVVLAFPTYAAAKLADTDALHMTAEGSYVFGLYMAQAIKRTRIDGIPFRPLSPRALRRFGAVIVIDLHVPVPPVVIDPAFFGAVWKEGFKVSAGATQYTINSVTAISGHELALQLGSDPGGPVTVRYGLDYTNAALDGTNSGFAGALGGTVRDSAALPHDIPGISDPVHNWLIHFEQDTPQ